MNYHHRNRDRVKNAPPRQMPDIPWSDANAPNFSLDRQIAEARRDMGAARWNELQREWL